MTSDAATDALRAIRADIEGVLANTQVRVDQIRLTAALGKIDRLLGESAAA